LAAAVSKRALFRLGLAGLLVLFAGYGLVRFRLGVDLTDEGAYLAWPLRVHLGEARHAAETLTLNRPIEPYLAWLFDLRPGFTLYELRLVGWSLHLLAFAVFASFLFRLGQRPLQSLLAAAVPLFFCHIFGLAVPAYNMLASDFLLLALSLWGRACLDERPRWPLTVAAGLAFFAATLAHPGLLLVAALWAGHEVFRSRGALRGAHQGAPLPSAGAGGGHVRLGGAPAHRPRLAGVAAFAAAGLALVAFAWASGDAARWLERLPFSRGVATSSQSWPLLLGRLVLYPFAFSHLGMACAAAGLAGLFLLWRRRSEPAGIAVGQWFAFGLVAGLLVIFRFQTGRLVPGFTLACLLALGAALLRAAQGDGPARATAHLVALSCLAGLVAATLTYQFTLTRSWTSGLIALPFAFGTGYILLLGRPGQRSIRDLLLPATLGLLVTGSAAQHYGAIQRDAPPGELRTGFNIPKLRHIRSTPERSAVLGALYTELHDKVKPGDTLLVFDDAPLLYYLFHARPAYGMAWAVRYGQTAHTLAELNREMNARPLPHYAIRTLVDPAMSDWASAPPTTYENYPLNDTLLARYERVRTIHPFEIWRLKDRGEKTSPPAAPN
jgi:hypothetical protein